uniref:Transposase n=1 Tax=Panagrellus redivivus TaxID=6233 RepID=A0A7E4WDB9_PANRE
MPITETAGAVKALNTQMAPSQWRVCNAFHERIANGPPCFVTFDGKTDDRSNVADSLMIRWIHFQLTVTSASFLI